MTSGDCKQPDTRRRFGRHGRLAVRVGCLAAAVVCLWPVHVRLMPLVGAASPFVAIVSPLAGRTLHAVLIAGLAVALAAAFRHRFFCRWMCPTGLCIDGAGALGRRLGRRPLRGVSAGRWLLVMTVGGAIFGLPMFLWLDPLALFSGVFTAAVFLRTASAWLAAIFGLVLLASALWPNVWCSGICPSGALQDLLGHLRRRFSRAQLKPAKAESGSVIGRRAMLGVALGVGGTALTRPIRGAARPLRPPGARKEPTFNGMCTRCGNCARACPYGVIHRDTGGHGLLSLLTPVMSFENDYCRADCTRCTEVCPNGAIRRVPLAAKPAVRIGVPRIDMRICLLGDDRECSACRRWCPYEAIRYVFCEDSYSLVPVIDPARCNGCGACEFACPTRPVRAICIVRD